MDLDSNFKREFESLIRLEGLDKLNEIMEISDYEELPLYSRLAQVSFLDHLTVIERNRALIRAAVSHLSEILEYSREYYGGRDYDYFCMVSITDWEAFDEGGLITPAFWFTNPSRGILSQLRLNPPNSVYSDFVFESINSDPSFKINESISQSSSGPYVDRVYVQSIASSVGKWS